MIPLILALVVEAGPTRPLVLLQRSGVYDVSGSAHRPDCPALSEDERQAAFEDARAFWLEHVGEVYHRIEKATGTSLAADPIVAYVVTCGIGISDPLTFPLWTWDTEGKITKVTRRQFLEAATHELLHLVAGSSTFEVLQDLIAKRCAHESVIVVNHVLMLAFETRIYGYGALLSRYSEAPDYLRALEIGKELNLTHDEPIP